MTERLYYRDCYLREFRARVVEAADGGRRVYLDRTAFYPTSGGQPFDTGTLGGAPVRDVFDEGERVAHVLDAPLAASGEVTGTVDWTRRYDHMQQHTGQHLLSAVFEELYGMRTVSFHLGAESSTIDITAASLEPEQVRRVEQRCAELVGQAVPVIIGFEDAANVSGLRKESEREGVLRIISIQGVDRSACGGTHVRSTAEIGPVLLRKLEKVRGNVRVEFVCGGRALDRAHRDFEILSGVSRALAAPFEKAPELIGAQAERIKSLEKTALRLAVELAAREGREMHAAAEPDRSGIRRIVQRGPIDDATRARAQAFVTGGKSAFLAISENPPAVLLAVSPDSGMHAGDLLKGAVTSAGGRGGGSATLAQGSAPSTDALEAIAKQLGSEAS
jgi:alanyl-tRNA synthetase